MTDRNDPWRAARRSMAELDAGGTRTHSLLGVIALVASAVLILVAAGLFGVNVNRLSDSFRWVHHTDEVLLTASQVREAQLEAATYTRNYLLTGDAAYLPPQRAAQARMDAALDRLVAVVADNPDQRARALALRGVIKARETVIADLGGISPATRQQLIAGMQGSGPAKGFSDFFKRVSTLFGEFRAAEQRLQREREESAETAEKLTLSFAFITAILAVLAGGAGVYFIQRERTENRAREMELMLTHTQRLSLMGETSLALAHELNQPLSAAGNYLSALKRFLASENTTSRDRADDTAEKARAQVMRAGEIVKRLRNFVAHGDNERATETVDTLFTDAVALLGTLDDSVALHRAIEPNLPPVFVDRIQIQQVLVNLMRNAIEAMKQSPKRELTLRAVRRDANMVQISLQDSGSGLSPEIAARLFRPFVTTKSNGMGVGLSICQRIVLDHGGRIWAESVAGEGALFCFTLPIAQADEAAAA